MANFSWLAAQTRRWNRVGMLAMFDRRRENYMGWDVPQLHIAASHCIRLALDGRTPPGGRTAQMSGKFGRNAAAQIFAPPFHRTATNSRVSSVIARSLRWTILCRPRAEQALKFQTHSSPFTAASSFHIDSNLPSQSLPCLSVVL